MFFHLFSSFGVIHFGQFLLGTIAIILLPGPNSLYVLASSAKRGWYFGALAALGVILGDTVLMFAAATGATAMLKAFPLVYLALRWIGAAYLAWIGWGLINAGGKKWLAASKSLEPRIDERPQKQLDSVHPTKAALGLSLTNPKAIFFFISFFTQFVDPNAEFPGLAFLILGVVLQVISMIYLSTLILAGATLSRAFHERARVAATGMILVGFIFAGFGINLIVAS